EFGKFTSQDGESLESYYSRLIRNQYKLTNHQVNIQFLLQLQPEWQRFVTLVKQSQELKTVSYYKLYDILKQHQHEVNEIRAEKIARVANPLVLVSQLKPIDKNDEDADLSKERELLASLIEKLKCEINESKNRNKFLETSNKVLIDKLKSKIKDIKNKNNSLELSNNQFKEANNKLSAENDLLYTDFKKSQAELKRRNSIEYASEMELECAKVRCDFLSYKMEYQKSCNKYTQTINDLNQTILEMKNKLSAHQDTISILKQQKDAKTRLYKTREDKEIKKVIELENKVKVLDNIVYKTGQSVQTMNML
nr:hypothetical protein [Tanacetum cinerariifolium]